MPKLRKVEYVVLVALLVLSIVPSVGGIVRLVDLSTGSAVLPVNPRAQSTPLPFVYHIIASTLFCVLGAFQLLPSFRVCSVRWHRRAGRILVFAGLMSAVTGLWMTHFFNFPDHLQTGLLHFARFVVGGLMMLFLVFGVLAAVIKEISYHRAWMIRAYALGQGAGTQVITAIPWLVMVGEPSGLVREVLMIFSWLVNVFVAEWVIRRSAPNKTLAKVA